MKKIFLLAAVVLLLFETGQMLWRIRAGRMLAEQSRPFSRENQVATFRILIAGDSTGVGTGANIPEESIAGFIARDYPNVSIVNIAENGLRTEAIGKKLLDEQQKDFDLVIVHVGANDILHFTRIEKLEEDITQTLEAAKNRGRNVVLLTSGNVGVAPIFPQPIGWIFTHRTRTVRALFQQKAREQGVIYIDLFAERKEDPFLKDPEKFYARDMLHPSSDGYHIWYDKFIETLQKNNIPLK